MTADPKSLQRVSAELLAREPIFHRPEFGTSQADFAAMMDEEFFEIGASGKRYSRQFVLDALALRDHSVAEHLVVTDFSCRQISADTWLVTYLLEQAQARMSRRSTLWRHSARGWKILYHQGTLIADT